MSIAIYFILFFFLEAENILVVFQIANGLCVYMLLCAQKDILLDQNEKWRFFVSLSVHAMNK